MKYFAYGSNLNQTYFQSWCLKNNLGAPSIIPVRQAYLPDFALRYHYPSSAWDGGGALDVEPARGCAVPGVVFEIDRTTLLSLDRKEGAPTRYRRVKVQVFDSTGAADTVLTYRVNPEFRGAHVRPSEAYDRVVQEGAREFGLDASAFERAKQDQVPWPAAVFAYGTLMRGQSRSQVLAQCGAEFRAAGTLRGKLLDLGDYPGLVAGDDVVTGEVFTVTDPNHTFAVLDEIEGFGGYQATNAPLYRRVLRKVQLESTNRWAFAYEYACKTNRM